LPQQFHTDFQAVLLQKSEMLQFALPAEWGTKKQIIFWKNPASNFLAIQYCPELISFLYNQIQ
jgi:hypothetical protein